MSGLIVLFWFVGEGVALRYFVSIDFTYLSRPCSYYPFFSLQVLFIGVMSCLYCLWDVIDDTIARKVPNSDASEFARICGCCPSRGKHPVPHTNCVVQLLNSFSFSLGSHLAGSGDHFFRSWYNHWSPCIQSKSVSNSSTFPFFSFLFRFWFVEHENLLFVYYRKVLNNKQAIHLISLLFQDPIVVHFLWNQVIWFYYLHSRCCSPPRAHCKNISVSYIDSDFIIFDKATCTPSTSK